MPRFSALLTALLYLASPPLGRGARRTAGIIAALTGDWNGNGQRRALIVQKAAAP